MTLSAILVAIIGGAIIGLLGRMIAPGDKDNVPLWLTVILGIVGAFVGTALYSMFFHPETKGIDWWRHIWQIAVATVLVMITSVALARSRRV